jgi:hypothetical protein
MAELLYVISSQLTKFIRADKFVLSMPLQHKFANRYLQFFKTREIQQNRHFNMTSKQILFIVSVVFLTACNQNRQEDLDQNTSTQTKTLIQKDSLTTTTIKDSNYTADKEINDYLNFIRRRNLSLTQKEKEIINLISSIPEVNSIMNERTKKGKYINLRITTKTWKDEGIFYEVWGDEYHVTCNMVVFVFHVNPKTFEIKNYDMATGGLISVDQWKDKLKK